MQQNILETAQVTPGKMTSDSIRRITRKRSRDDGTQMEGVGTPGQIDHNDLLVRESAQGSSRETLSIVDLESEQQVTV